MKIVIGYIYAFYATKMGSRDSGEKKVVPHWVQDPPWSFNGPCHGPTINQTWSFIYWLFFTFYATKWDQGTLGTQRSTLIGSRNRLGPSMDPAIALQYTQHDPLYIGCIFTFYATKIGSNKLWGHKG